jgi:hypothetical protein
LGAGERVEKIDVETGVYRESIGNRLVEIEASKWGDGGRQRANDVADVLGNGSRVSRDRFLLAREQSLLTREQNEISREQTLVTRDLILLTRDPNLLASDLELLARDLGLLARDRREISREQNGIARDEDRIARDLELLARERIGIARERNEIARRGARYDPCVPSFPTHDPGPRRWSRLAAAGIFALAAVGLATKHLESGTTSPTPASKPWAIERTDAGLPQSCRFSGAPSCPYGADGDLQTCRLTDETFCASPHLCDRELYECGGSPEPSRPWRRSPRYRVLVDHSGHFNRWFAFDGPTGTIVASWGAPGDHFAACRGPIDFVAPDLLECDRYIGCNCEK